MNSLRFKVLIAMVALTALGSTITAVIASRFTADLFRQYSAHPMGRREEPFVRILEQRYTLNGTWEDVQPLLIDLGQAIEERVILAEGGGLIIGDSDGKLIGKMMADEFPPTYFPIMKADQAVGKLYIDPFKTRNIKDDLFLGRINHSFLIGSLVVIVLAVLLTIIVTRPIIRPMEELTEAVQKMEKGDLSVRVNIHSKDETGRLARAFNKMAESLSTLEQLRQNMVSDVAHELRTPLSNVRGYLEASRDGLLKTDENLVNNLYEEAMLLTRLVDDLQDLALAESGHLGLDFQPIEIGSLVETSIELCRTQAQSREIGLQTDISPGLPLIKADAQRLLQVFRNLINNALEHTPTVGKIIIAACPEQGNVHIRVTDNGIGIPSDQLELIFERFYRADPSRVRSTGGRGLGLSIVKKFIDLHGGSVWAESQPGNGSTFHIILPGIQTI